MATSAVPVVLDAVRALVIAAVPAAAVIDGPLGKISPSAEMIFIGGAVDGEPGVFATQERKAGLSTGRRENIVIVCRLRSWSGDVEIKPRRDQCAAMLAAIESALRVEMMPEGTQLGGLVDLIELGPDLVWTPSQTAAGAMVTVAFTIEAMALI